ncbi:MAG TPA: IclR family transcriptional regulator [Solirubrobacteraceae bacterium]|nr:IclR family transcriptional regulator [Solirubrobacteraceae bacterium]
MSGTSTPPDTGTQSAARVADLLLALADGPAGVSALAARTGMSKAVAHRILQSLRSRDLVGADGRGSYRLGVAAAALGARALARLDLRSSSLPILRELRELTQETTTLSALSGLARVYLAQVVSPQEVKMTVEVGRPFPLHAGASSKAILAHADPELREQVLSRPLVALTPYTPVTRAELERELATIAAEGVAVSRGERQAGAGSVAAPLFGPHGEVVGSISVCGPVDRFDGERARLLAEPVREAAAAITRRLGELDRTGG